MKYISLLLILCCNIILYSQNANSTSYIIEKQQTIHVASHTSDFFSHLQSIEAPSPDGISYASFLMREKNRLFANVNSSSSVYKNNATNTATNPILIKGFEGNAYDAGVPTDNNIAISNGGKIVSVINSTIYFYDVSVADTPTRKISLEAFTDTAATNAYAHKFDPKVTYDPKNDRFILVYLSGSSSDATHIVVCFSASNDPLGIWHQYSINGNPFSNTTWSDYPIIAQTDSEFYVTINLIYDDSTWQAGFQQSLIWQINKKDGYVGNPLHMLRWDNIGFGGRMIRNLCPMQGGATTYGPEMYFMSNRNFSSSNDTFFILKLNQTQYNSPTLQVNVGISDIAYGLPPNGKQRSGLFLQTNDARILGGYYENNAIHFVGNTVDDNNMRAAVYHGIATNLMSSNTIKLHKIQDTAFDYGYPNIAYSGRYAGDEQAIIGFDFTSQDTFPSFAAVFYEKWAGYSNPLLVKAGLSVVNILPGTLERWGDYFGIQRKYNEPGIVWLNGFYGKRLPGLGSPNANHAWIASLQSPYSVGVTIQEPKPTEQLHVYPNPAYDKTEIKFTLENKEWIEISIVDMQGKTIAVLFRDIASAGDKLFSFSTHPLSNGNYMIYIKNAVKVKYSEKILVQH